MKNKILNLIFLMLLTSCVKKTDKYLILDYNDFGPQLISYETIGNEWWQWNNNGDSDPKTRYDVKVVVYRDIPLKKIQARFPVIKNEKKDFRYIEYQNAIEYFNKNISQLSNNSSHTAKELCSKLAKVRDKIKTKI